MGNLQSNKSKMKGSTHLWHSSSYTRLSSSPSSTQHQPLLVKDDGSPVSSSQIVPEMCIRDYENDIEAIRRADAELTKKVNELARKQKKENHGADIEKIYEIIADQGREIQRLNVKIITLEAAATSSQLSEEHSQRNSALVETNVPAESLMNQPIPDLMSFEPMTLDVTPHTNVELEQHDFNNDSAAGMIIVIFLLAVLIGLNL